ncbi:MAG TPA: Rv3654c family TadE-like protein [Actinomycetota bacterium]|nr:Rv3654c family TadE-like protein [Actinomycetota bacterium]
MNDRGAVTSLMMATLALVALLCLAFADAANVLLARSRAQTAADAAALTAAVEQWPFLGGGSDPPTAARRMAEANGAELELCECPLRGSRADVEVSVPTRVRLLGAAPRRVTAVASASVDPGALFREPTGSGP